YQFPSKKTSASISECDSHSCYCEKCYKEWYKVAINHKEDREIEKDVYENIKSKITNIYF
ncbi:hypothetical protein EJP19_08775, partial [Campylobacter coli]|nr:hypothetical protein [Campylobacter coli]